MHLYTLHQSCQLHVNIFIPLFVHNITVVVIAIDGCCYNPLFFVLDVVVAQRLLSVAVSIFELF